MPPPPRDENSMLAWALEVIERAFPRPKGTHGFTRIMSRAERAKSVLATRNANGGGAGGAPRPIASAATKRSNIAPPRQDGDFNDFLASVGAKRDDPSCYDGVGVGIGKNSSWNIDEQPKPKTAMELLLGTRSGGGGGGGTTKIARRAPIRTTATATANAPAPARTAAPAPAPAPELAPREHIDATGCVDMDFANERARSMNAAAPGSGDAWLIGVISSNRRAERRHAIKEYAKLSDAQRLALDAQGCFIPGVEIQGSDLVAGASMIGGLGAIPATIFGGRGGGRGGTGGQGLRGGAMGGRTARPKTTTLAGGVSIAMRLGEDGHDNGGVRVDTADVDDGDGDTNANEGRGDGPAAPLPLPKLEPTTWTAIDAVKNPDAECGITFDPFEIGDAVVRLGCGHLFTPDAIAQVVEPKCPMCGSSMT